MQYIPRLKHPIRAFLYFVPIWHQPMIYILFAKP